MQPDTSQNKWKRLHYGEKLWYYEIDRTRGKKKR